MTARTEQTKARQNELESEVALLDAELPATAETNPSKETINSCFERLSTIAAATCLSEPDNDLFDWETAQTPARADGALLETIKGFSTRLPEIDYVIDEFDMSLYNLDEPMPQWVEQLEAQAKLADFFSAIAALPEKDELDHLLDEAIALTCPHDEDSITAYATESDVAWLNGFKGKLEQAGVDVSPNGDYEYLKSHLRDAGTFEQYLDGSLDSVKVVALTEEELANRPFDPDAAPIPPDTSPEAEENRIAAAKYLADRKANRVKTDDDGEESGTSKSSVFDDFDPDAPTESDEEALAEMIELDEHMTSGQK